MSSFPSDDVRVTLTGEEWTSILAQLARPGALSQHGRNVYLRASTSLAEQLTKASQNAWIRELVHAGKWPPQRGEIDPRKNPHSNDAGGATILILPTVPRSNP